MKTHSRISQRSKIRSTPILPKIMWKANEVFLSGFANGELIGEALKNTFWFEAVFIPTQSKASFATGKNAREFIEQEFAKFYEALHEETKHDN